MSGAPLPTDATVWFAAGLPGFESCRRFLLVQSPEFSPGVCLKGLEGDAPTFVAVDPRQVDPEFRTTLSQGDRARLGADAETPCVWLVIVSCADARPRANMRAPIVINPATMRGIQVVPSDAAVAVDLPWPEVVCSS
jgi:flagellar assembly factor FliW